MRCMMGQMKPLVNFFTVMFFLSCLLPLGAVPTCRSLVSGNQESPPVKVMNEEMAVVERELVNRRMDIESNDYPGTGANNRHDPRIPGRE